MVLLGEEAALGGRRRYLPLRHPGILVTLAQVHQGLVSLGEQENFIKGDAPKSLVLTCV